MTSLHDGVRTTTASAVEMRGVFGCYPTGVAALCAVGDDGVPDGMAISTFAPVSLDPPMVSVCVQGTSATWPRLRRLGRLGLSVLAEGQDAVARSLAARGVDRFAGVDWTLTGEGAVLVDGAVAWLDCEVEREMLAGDHLIVLLRIHSLSGDPHRPPLVFHGGLFRGLRR
ncbi:flavin reductase family protein [Streptomyces sp. NPDC090106]|uniref:flavin reductase family protein n=1 Tax=Streptomyces sp. NPDC090106 TaxID=3365946 RepID=UPI0037F65353